MSDRNALNLLLLLATAVAVAGCGGSTGPFRASLQRPAGSTERALRVRWELAAEPESATDPEPHTAVTLRVDGLARAAWALGRFRGSCWTSEQGFARGSSDALSSVQCVFAGSGAALSLVRAAPGALEVRARIVDETAPNESGAPRTLLVVRLPEDADISVSQ